MSFVFISHASRDKPRIRHIVDALIADGHKVWVDNPADMGYDVNEIRSHFIRLRSGSRWHDQIDEAIREAGAVLVCFSKSFSELRDVWHDEASGARMLGKLVGCRIDDVDTKELRNRFSLEQMPDVQPERSASELKIALDLLMEDVRLKLSATIDRLFQERKQRRIDPDTPYLIDRTTQEEQIGDAIEHVDINGGVRALFVAGPENECVDEFIKRLERHTCPDRLNGRMWHCVTVEWPKDQRGPDFVKTFLRRCASQLRQPHNADEDTIADALARIGRPVAVFSLITASEWQADEEKRISDWLQVWHRLAVQPQRFSALPILCLKMPPAQPGWKIYPDGTAAGAILSNAAIWRAVEAVRRGPGRWEKWFARRQPERAAIEVPPFLHPVTRSHADMWLAHPIVSRQLGNDPADAKTSIRSLFDGRAAIPLEAFADKMKSLFQGGT